MKKALVALVACLLPLPVGSQPRPARGVVPADQRVPKATPFYTESHALLIGASAYTEGWPSLKAIPAEIDQVADVLGRRGFVVHRLLDPSHSELREGFWSFINEQGFSPGKRLLIWFSGHGYTHRDTGYLVPVNAPDPQIDEMGFFRKTLTMNQVQTWARTIKANHVLFLFDSCFSGTVFSSRGLLDHSGPDLEKFKRPVRQFITAGSADETVPAKSQFAPAFVRALEGQRGENADANGDGVVTGTELGFFLQTLVQTYNPQQTPQFGKINDAALDQGEFLFFVGSPKKQPEGQCHDIRTHAAESFPLALLNTSKVKDTPYWFHVTFENRCVNPLHAEFTFQVVDGPARCDLAPQPLTVGPGEIASRFLSPSLEFTGLMLDSAEDMHLKVAWWVRDDAQSILDSDTATILLLPKSTYGFDLRTVDGTRLDDRFLLATLAAWAISPSRAVKRLSRSLRDERDWAALPPPLAEPWLELCCERLFRSEGAVRVFRNAEPFPPRDRRTILPPAQVLEEQYADQIDAALLIAAVSRRNARITGFHPALVVAPATDGTAWQRTYLAWETVERGWQALDLAKVSSIDFFANVTAASPELVRILAEHPSLREALADTGVYCNENRSILAIHFDRASKIHRIKGLP
jgi:hypothetical protein